MNGFNGNSVHLTSPRPPPSMAVQRRVAVDHQNMEIEDLTMTPDCDRSAKSDEIDIEPMDDVADNESEPDSVDSICSYNVTPPEEAVYPDDLDPDDTTDIALKMKFPRRPWTRCIRPQSTEMVRFRVCGDGGTEDAVKCTADLIGDQMENGQVADGQSAAVRVAAADNGYDAVSSPLNEVLLSSLSAPNVWSLTLCMEETETTDTAKPGDIIPMVCYGVRGSALPPQYRCGQMVRYQWTGGADTARAVSWCQTVDSRLEQDLECEIKEFVDLQFEGADGQRTAEEVRHFEQFLTESHGAFIYPGIHDNEYVVGLKVLNTVQSFIDHKVHVKALVFKIAISNLEGPVQRA